MLERAVEKELAPLGLHHGQGRILTTIASCGLNTQAELARLIDIKPAMVTNMLKPLKKKKLIRRKLDSITHRTVLVSLTSAGEEACAAIHMAWERIEKQMLQKLTDIGTQPDELFQTLEPIRITPGGRHMPKETCNSITEV